MSRHPDKRSANEGNRPAIYAAQFALSHGCWLIAYALAGWIGGMLSLMAAFLLLGLVSLASTAAALKLYPVDDPLELDHTHEPARHDHRHLHDEHHHHDHEGWEGPEPHRHSHTHSPVTHKHAYVIDLHHPEWPTN